MYFYNLTLKQPTAITHAVVGQFSTTREDHKKGHFEIAVAKGNILEILKPDETTGRLQSLISHNVFDLIRSIAAFRLTGGFRDYLAIGSVSGRISILEYIPEKSAFEAVQQESFGRSGARRIVPGQYLACDSKGRAVMVAALEKQKLVYQLNRDTQANLTISSPLEAHKANTIVCDIINVDVGYENPLFACLESEYEDDDDPTGYTTKQALTYYELDLGLNYVVRKYSEPLDDYGNILIPVPGGEDGPSGLLVCFENFITYKNFGEQPDIKCPIPRRKGETDVPDRGVIIASSATFKYLEEGKRKFFFLIQTELGDVFKTEFEISDEIVTNITMTYFDSLPVAKSLCLLPYSRRRVDGALLFVAAESGNHKLYQIEQVEDQEAQSFSSKTYQKYLKNLKNGEIDEDNKLFQFKPTDLRNLNLVDEIQSMAPLLYSTSHNPADDHQLVVSCGKNRNSSVRVLRHGLEVTERVATELPSVATGVWSVKKRCNSQYDEYIVVSFTNATLVLGVGETIEEVVDSGLLSTKRTLGCGQLGDDSLVQVHPEGIRHIHADKRVNEWRTPFKRQIVRCAINQRQVAIAMSNHEILYFEMDTTGQLNEYNERKEFPGSITCMALGEIPAGEVRSQFLAVGVDQKVCVISLDLDDCMTERTRQNFSSSIESITISELGGGRDLNYIAQLYLNVGLQNGELVRTRLDRVTGDLSDPLRRYLGSKPITLHNVKVKQKHSVLACTNKNWLVYYHQNRCHLSPLTFEAFDHATAFSSPQFNEAILAITSNELRILTLERLGDMYNQQEISLEVTPKKFVVHPHSGNIVAVMTDRQPLLIHPEDEADKWRSMVALIDANSQQILREFKFESHQAALCIAQATFGTSSTTIHVGVTNYYKLRYNFSQSNEIHTFSLSDRGDDLQLMHVTGCEEIPRAICAFQDRLAVGMGKVVRIYDLGKKKLLRKCQNEQLPYFISTIHCSGNRMFVGDARKGIYFMKYRRNENKLHLFADDNYIEDVTSSGVIDSNTIAAGDKLGNIHLLQLADEIDDDKNYDLTGTRSSGDRSWLGGTPQKAKNIASFHVGQMITSIQSTSLTLGRAKCILYTTISGSIGSLISFDSKDEFEFVRTLELHMRRVAPPLCGRDHLAYRSSYGPLKDIVDGDLCEHFLALDPETQMKIADEMDRQPGELISMINEMIERIK